MRRKARNRLRKRTKMVWTTSKGKAWFSGLSPCHAPSDDTLAIVTLCDDVDMVDEQTSLRWSLMMVTIFELSQNLRMLWAI